MSELLDTALKYAKYGFRIHPCRKDKKPYLNEWQNKATTDTETIKKWWQEYPGASIGCVTGPASGVWVLDIDLPDGPDTLQALQKENGELPKTFKQQTGSGGFQLFFNYNGTEIRNSSRKVGPGVDVRGKNGFCILPPSPHPSGNQYQWIEKQKHPAQAPDWLVELVKTPPEPETYIYHGKAGQYGRKALADEIVKLSMATEGNRNDTLNTSAYSLGQLVAGGELEHDHVFHSLLSTAQTVGLKKAEATKTIQSGMKGGMQHPRTAPEKDDFEYDLNDDQHNQHDQQNQHQSASVSISKQKSASVSINQQEQQEHNDPQNDKGPVNIENLKDGTDNATRAPTHACAEDKEKSNYSTLSEGGLPPGANGKEPPHNLKAAIYQFIENTQGSFTTRDIDTEFGLKTRKEKNARSRALNTALNDNLIKRDKKTAGKYHIISVDIDWVDIEAEEPESFPVKLPFDLHKYCNIPPGSIIILAGSSNAGKTALILNAIRMNLQQKYKILYLMSEMGSGEFKSRIKSFQDPLNRWKKLQAASKSYDFESAVQHYNPNGLTCIDYLEEIDGEYFKIASNIRDIYDALQSGVAFIAIQKKADADFARGGESTREKARLYMTLDYLATQEHSIVCALKITKNKHPLKRNLNYHELHFRITNGAQIEPITDWIPSSKVDRKKAAAQYELGRDDLGERDYVFQTDKGQRKVIKEKDVVKWQETFENIDVDQELSKLSRDSYEKPFIKHKDYFFQISGILRKRNIENVKQ